jgi:hypothetical protein
LDHVTRYKRRGTAPDPGQCEGKHNGEADDGDCLTGDPLGDRERPQRVGFGRRVFASASCLDSSEGRNY